MPVNLILAAANWEPKEVKCTFTVLADEVILVAKDRSKRIYELPAGAKKVRVIAKPKTSDHWESMVALVVASNGTVSPDAGLAAWVGVTQASGATAGATLVTVRVSRFKDVTHQVRDLLKGVVPGVAGKPRKGGAPDQAQLVATYGKWPPDDLNIDPLPKALVLDAANPVTPGGLLSFKASPVAVDADSVVLELAGVKAPRLFGVVWPDAVRRKVGAVPTPFFFYIRQTGGQDKKNVFVSGGVKGPYPYNFDYAERCLFESQHYSSNRFSLRRDAWMLRPKGVPYQVTRSGAKVVMVFPVADSDDTISYGVLSNFDEMGRLLAELQAFMFWTAGIAAPPSTVGKTVLSAYSSANGTLVSWLNNNGASTFLENNISAVYFLDPPPVDDCVDAGLLWRKRMGNDKRVRLYSARNEKRFVPAYRRLLGLEATDTLQSPPYLLSAAGSKITMALFPTETWTLTFKDILGPNRKWVYWDAHHFVPATVLTHALAQGDI